MLPFAWMIWRSDPSGKQEATFHLWTPEQVRAGEHLQKPWPICASFGLSEAESRLPLKELARRYPPEAA